MQQFLNAQQNIQDSAIPEFTAKHSRRSNPERTAKWSLEYLDLRQIILHFR
jgi:hypothetical protein